MDLHFDKLNDNNIKLIWNGKWDYMALLFIIKMEHKRDNW